MKQAEITLAKYKGQAVALAAMVRKANVEDQADFVALQAAVHAAMPDPSLYVASTAQELQQDLANSLCIGVWVEQAQIAEMEQQPDTAAPAEQGTVLVAYCIMRYDGANPHNYANYFDLPQAEIPLWANMDSVVVLPAYRGNQLQQQLFEFTLAWRRPEIIGVGCTISPNNAHSLANAEALGFAVHSRRVMYGCHDRYLLQKRLMPLPGKYRHFKGGEYRVLSIATHSETLAPMVVYQTLYGKCGIWVRPAELWFEWVDRDGYKGPRFMYIGDEDNQ